MDKRPKWRNWAGNQTATPDEMFYPCTEEVIIEIVRRAGDKGRTIRVAGTGHSWSPIIAGSDYIVLLKNYNKILSHDADKLTITCQAGIRIHDVAEYAHQLGWSLPNLAFLDVQTMGSMLSTTTHGCGREQPLIAEHIISARFVNGQAVIVELSKSDEDFSALKTGLGLLGLASTMTIQCQSAKSVVSNNQVLSDRQWMQQFDELNKQSDFFDVWWLPHTNKAYVMSPRFVDESFPALSCTQQRFWDRWGAVGISLLQRSGTKLSALTPWLNRIAFAFGFRDQEIKGPLHQVLSIGTDIKYRIYNCEYSFPIAIGHKVLNEIKTLTDAKKLLLPCLLDIRTMKADNNYLSLAYGQDVMTIGCTINSESKQVPEILYQVEAIYKKYLGRPHLCKVFAVDNDYLKRCYPKLEALKKSADYYDPEGVFRTKALAELFWGKHESN